MKQLITVVAILNSTFNFCGFAAAQETVLRFQYRYRNESIPSASSDEPMAAQFSPTAAKDYIESGATLWSKQKKCFSCHTHGIYSFVRPALSSHWGKPNPELRSFVVQQAEKIKRNGGYSGSTPAQMAYIARGLASWDSNLSEQTSPETDAALRYLFEMQAEDGSILVKDRWPPLNSNTYHGTVMAAIAVAEAPGWLDNLDDSELLAKIGKLKDFMRKTAPKNDHERVLLLWASTYMSNILSDERKRNFVEMIWKQQLDDGGWSIRTFATPETLGGGKRAESLKDDPGFANPVGDGYQTGLVLIVLRDTGVEAQDPRIKKAVQWLLSNQRMSGRWWTRSLNTTSRFHFITYSGTAYSALALAKCNALPDSK